MIRRTVKSGLLATVAVLALLPSAAGAAEAAPTARHSATASAQLAPSSRLPRHSAPALGRVTTHRARLNVRSGPGTRYRVVGHRRTGRLVTVVCRTTGSRVGGTRTWYRLSRDRGYVSAHYLRVGSALPWC
ncbi:SH3 domain-containing protein [Streptomyces sp. NPDC086787]|uniref:SH3 domain-containing protein n=1 Tax=Streptomyces sp. NPDC086787 TaxID=3365759 RepID=UPI0038007234